MPDRAVGRLERRPNCLGIGGPKLFTDIARGIYLRRQVAVLEPVPQLFDHHRVDNRSQEFDVGGPLDRIRHPANRLSRIWRSGDCTVGLLNDFERDIARYLWKQWTCPNKLFGLSVDLEPELAEGCQFVQLQSEYITVVLPMHGPAQRTGLTTLTGSNLLLPVVVEDSHKAFAAILDLKIMPSKCNRRTLIAAVGSAGITTGLTGCLGNRNNASTPESTPVEPPNDTTTTSTRTDLTDDSPTNTSTSIDPDELTGHVRPNDDPQDVPSELECTDENFERRTGWVEEEALQWGNLTNEEGDAIFALRVDSLSVTRGESVTFTLTNVSGKEQGTGNTFKSNLDVFTDAGWQDPRGWVDGQPRPITDELRTWVPGERDELTFEMTEEGIVEDGYHSQDQLVTCPGLPAGRYRFATAAPDQGDVGVAFDLTE